MAFPAPEPDVTVHKIIFRADFDASFDIMDRPGKVLSTVRGVGTPDFWGALHEARDNRRVGAVFDEPNKANARTSREFWVNPTFVLFSYESMDPIEFSVAHSYPLGLLVEAADAIRQKFGLNLFKRIGFRATSFGVSHDFKSRAPNLLVASALLSSVSPLGAIGDIGINLNGKTNLGEYKLSVGPFVGEEDFTKFLPKLHHSTDFAFDFMWDIDLYETDVALSSFTFESWIRARMSLVKQFEKKLVKLVEDHDIN